MSGQARAAILADIRRALGPASTPAPPRPAPSYRLAGTRDRDILLDAFCERAAGYKVRVERVPRAEVAATAARLLAARGLVRIACPTDLPAAFRPEGVDLLPDDALSNDAIAACDGVLTTCVCAIAQTGTVVLDHGAGQGRRVLTLLPDYHLCVVEADCMVELVPEAVRALEPSVRAGRPLTFVSGPSATSDIELSRVEGVHGPRTLDIIVSL